MEKLHASEMLGKEKLILEDSIRSELEERANRAVSVASANGSERSIIPDAFSYDLAFIYTIGPLEFEVYFPDYWSKGDSFGQCYLTIKENGEKVLEQYRTDGKSQGFFTYKNGEWERFVDAEFEKIKN